MNERPDRDHSSRPPVPDHAADAWAAVYIDVAEKLDAEDRQASGANRQESAVSSLSDALTTGSMDACDVEVAFRSVVFHELAHILTWQCVWPDRRRNSPSAPTSTAITIGQYVADPEPPIYSLIPFYGHGVCFIRAALHLCHRAQAAGRPVSDL